MKEYTHSDNYLKNFQIHVDIHFLKKNPIIMNIYNIIQISLPFFLRKSRDAGGLEEMMFILKIYEVK